MLRLKPYLTAAECIDWSIPMLSIFATPSEAKAWAEAVNKGRQLHERIGVPRRPLKPKTLERIARGLDKFVIKAKRPFIVDIQNYGWNSTTVRDVDQPMPTVTGGPKGGGFAAVDVAVAPYTAGCGGRAGQSPATPIDSPLRTVTGKADRVLAAATLQTLNHAGQEHRAQTPDEPLQTVTGARDARALVAALVTKHYGDSGQRPGSGMDEPLSTITAYDHNAITCAYLSHLYGTNNGSNGEINKPAPTVTGSSNHTAVIGVTCSAFDRIDRGNEVGNGPPSPAGDSSGNTTPMPAMTGMAPALQPSGAGSTVKPVSEDGCATSGDVDGCRSAEHVAPFMVGAGGAAYAGKPKPINEPANTVMVNDRRALVAAFLATYYGNSGMSSPGQPMPTVVGKERIQLVTVVIDGQTYVVTDIAMRMLTPRELARAQGFDDSYIIDRMADGTRICKADQVKLIGNSVPPAFARAIVKANIIDQGVLYERPVAVGVGA